MNQVKTGEFLRELRKGKGFTQEQLAEQFNISRRSVSRWETGSNMPDVGLLIEIADFFDVDIREIIDGERKSENMDKEKETLKKIAEYADTEKAKLKKKVSNIFKWMCVMLLGSVLIGFFANQLDTILGCVCFTLGIVLLVGLSMLMSKQE
ncbi:MAG: helix-turn-helix transcriptional regulator [Lachnospiraceae bacterium]|nr:helix-turn-helix transcriptional regulator [Lachnospiraceae bacterium]